ncbi:MAG: A24 family peptidase [Planctomycetota bacterium]
MWVAVVAYSAVMSVCLAAAVFDMRTRRVPNALTYPAILLGLAGWAMVSAWSLEPEAVPGGWRACAVAVLVTAVPCGVLCAMGHLGGGDFKLMTAVAALSASWPMVLATAVYALLLAALGGLAMAIGKRQLGDVLRRLLGAALAGQAPPTAEQASIRIPLAVFIALGAAVAGAEHLLGWRSPWAWVGP